MAGAVRGSEANIGSGAFHGQLGAAAVSPGSFSHFVLSAVQVPVDVPSSFSHSDSGSVAYPTDIGASWRQLGQFVGPRVPGGVVPVHGYYSALQPRMGPGARRGVVLGGRLLPGGGDGAVYNWDYALQRRPGVAHGELVLDPLPDGARHGGVFFRLLPGGVDVAYDNDAYYALQPRPGAGHGDGEVPVDPLADGAGHGEAFVGLLPGGADAAYENYGHYALQPRPGAGYGEVFVDYLPDGAGHGEGYIGLLPGGVDAGYDNYGYDALQPRPGAGHGAVFVGLLSGGGVAVHDDYGYYYPLRPRPGARRGEVFVGPLPDGVGQNLLGTGGIDGVLRDPNLGARHDGSGALADDIGAVYNNRGMVPEHLRRLLPFVGIGASSVAINGLAAGPDSPAVAFHLFLLLLGGLFLVILHVLRV